MKKTEFISNLAYFAKEDYNTFLLFLRSPVFKKHGGLDKVFSVIVKRKKMLDSGNTDELKKIILKVAGITETTLMKIFSQLNESLIEYYRYKALYSSELYSAIALNDYMLGVNNPMLAQVAGTRAEQLLKDRFGENEQYFHNAFVYSAGKLNRLVHEQKLSTGEILSKQSEFTNEAAVNLYLYNVNKLVLMFINLVIKNVDSGNTDYETKPLDLDMFFRDNAFISEIEKHDVYHIMFILYQRAYELFSDLINDYKFTLFNDCFFVNLYLIPENSRKKFLNILITYCVLRQRLHDPERTYAERELRLLYQFIENEYYRDSSTNYLHSLTYHNFITGCLRVNNYGLMKKFIDKHTDRLIPRDMDKMKDFGLAHYYYGIKNYAKALKHINSIVNPGHFYKYDLKNLELKIYYEKKNFIFIDSVVHNYLTCVKDDEILTVYDRKRFTIFLSYFRKFVSFAGKPKSAGMNIELSMLLDKIEKEKNFAMQKWLIAEIKQILSEQTKPVRKYGNR